MRTDGSPALFTSRTPGALANEAATVAGSTDVAHSFAAAPNGPGDLGADNIGVAAYPGEHALGFVQSIRQEHA